MIHLDAVLRADVRDAWLYKGVLLVWDRQNRAFVYSLDDIQAQILRDYGPEVAALANYCLWRNDWRTANSTQTLVSVPAIRKALRDLGASAGGTISVELKPQPLAIVGSLSTEKHLLDVQIYANRVYLATTEALFESYIKPEHPADERETWPLLEHRVADVEARHGAVFAAAEEDGLWLSTINFDEDAWRPVHQPERVGEEAHRLSWTHRSLLAYTSQPLPDLLRTQGHDVRPHGNARFTAFAIESVEQDTSLGDVVSSTLADRRARMPDDVPVALGNSNYRLLMAWQEDWQVIDLRAFSGQALKAKPDQGFNSTLQPPVPSNAVLQTYGVQSGFVVETFDSVHLITASGVQLLLNEQAARVRTYPDSVRHKDVVSVMTDDALHLLGHWNV